MEAVTRDSVSPVVWIVDTSPFVGLAKVGHLHLLAAPSRQVWIVDRVEQEVMAGPDDDQAKDAFRQD